MLRSGGGEAGRVEVDRGDVLERAAEGFGFVGFGDQVEEDEQCGVRPWSSVERAADWR